MTSKVITLLIVLLVLSLALASWMQVRLGLRPLDTVREDLLQLDRAPDARLNEQQQLQEVRPLLQAINRLLDARANDIDLARRRSQDLAHALKTPLTALRLQIEQAPASDADKMLASLSLIRNAVDAELARNLVHDTAKSSPVASLTDRLWHVISRTPEADGIALDNQVDPDLKLLLSIDKTMKILSLSQRIVLHEGASQHHDMVHTLRLS